MWHGIGLQKMGVVCYEDVNYDYSGFLENGNKTLEFLGKVFGEAYTELLFEIEQEYKAIKQAEVDRFWQVVNRRIYRIAG